MLVQLFEAHNLRESHQGMLRHDTSESFWAHLDSLEPEMFMPGFYEIARLASSQGMLLKDLQIKSPFDASGDL